VLAELTIRNIAVIRETRIEFSPGMNVLTGETGAGKSIVLDALGAVLGARVSPELVRAGTERAYVEAVFDVPAEQHHAVVTLLNGLGVEVESDEPLVLSREIGAGGRSVARVNGRAMTAAILTQLGERLVDIHGQSDHLSLLRQEAQRALLDRFAGTESLLAEVGVRYRRWRELQLQLDRFDEGQRERMQRLDLLRFQSEEIDRAAPRFGEDEELRQERNRLVNAERLARLAAEAFTALAGDETSSLEANGGLDQVRAAEPPLEAIAEIDQELASTVTQLREAIDAVEEVLAGLRDYVEQIQFDPSRLAEIDERLETLRSLTRKYGPDIESVLAYAGQVQTEIQALEERDIDVESLRSEVAAARTDLAAVASDLSAERQRAGGRLAREIERSIAELNMGSADVDIRVEQLDSDEGIEVEGRRVSVDQHGIDRVTFYLAANRGEEPRPLARVASGGETARLMLALKSILSAADETPTLVFDEIDVGVGGRSGQVVGEKLWSLIDHHQTIVISHLPQVAAFADRHIRMDKREVDGRVETTAAILDEAASVDEIAQMFDGLPVTPESRANAVALIGRVNAWKQGRAS
jgi:DNA repair protein RecN (Recombination protein N)